MYTVAMEVECGFVGGGNGLAESSGKGTPECGRRVPNGARAEY